MLCAQGITFNAITVRIALHQSEVIQSHHNSSRGGVPSQGVAGDREAQVATIGSIPMRPMPISISITKDIEAHGDGYGDSDLYHKKKTTGSEDDIATVH